MAAITAHAACSSTLVPPPAMRPTESLRFLERTQVCEWRDVPLVTE